MNFLLKYIGLLAILFSLTLSGYSQEEETEEILPEIQRIQDTYEESIKVAATPLVTLGTKYIEAMNRQLDKAQKAGNFEEVVALKQAVEEFKKGEQLDGSSKSLAVAKLERIASQQIKIRLRNAEKPAFKAAQMRVSQLKQTLKDLTKSGNFESAEKVDQFIKSLPTRYDSSWAQSEIKRVASNDGVKIPITVAERPSLLFGEKEKPKRPPPKLTDPPEIESVKFMSNGVEIAEVEINEFFEIEIIARSLPEVSHASIQMTWEAGDNTLISSTFGFASLAESQKVEPLDNNRWRLICSRAKFSNPLQIGDHYISYLIVTNKLPSSNKFYRNQKKKIEVLPVGGKKDSNPKDVFEGLRSNQESETDKTLTPSGPKRPIIQSIEASTNKLIGESKVDFKVTYRARNEIRTLSCIKKYDGSEGSGSFSKGARTLNKEGYWEQQFTMYISPAKIGAHRLYDFYLIDTADVRGPEKRSSITIRVYKKSD